MADPKNDKSWGRGRWHSIHLTAAFSDNPAKQKYFGEWIRHQIANMPCGDCIKHATEYIQKNPPEQSVDPFYWAWEFHNVVNRRLGKPEMDYTTAMEIYMQGKIKVCNEGCGDPIKETKSAPDLKVKSNFSYSTNKKK